MIEPFPRYSLVFRGGSGGVQLMGGRLFDFSIKPQRPLRAGLLPFSSRLDGPFFFGRGHGRGDGSAAIVEQV